ncbi:V-type ATP synthase subunit D [Candidatus Atribacteria bacterium RBG_19FT_COMBO_35_14]|uniref:V-type ATP synthase subunit D n=1 Tax=Candidatus Sediminicultor quintus TaxID=1797291 RepID=A0A1F5A793_9BACT|nr:MAG: V-type ATP synthase subunit D [Candidatus Atribacteria bacterium RBG_19FT_COMBO_35_14]
MLLKVNPNRMELLRLKRRLLVAKRGYKLLKDKRDALIQVFVRLAKESDTLREELEENLLKCYALFSNASSLMSKLTLEETLMFPKAKSEIEVSFKNIMSVNVPQYKFKCEGKYYSYGLVDTAAELDGALKNFYDILPLMLKVAELDKAITLLANEIEKTRRRVNALEYVIIPDLEETITFITMKLDEVARSTNSAIMRIKDIIRA